MLDGNHEQNLKVVVTIRIANADNATYCEPNDREILLKRQQ